MTPLADDLRYSIRVVRKSLGPSVLAVLTIAWGIGSCTAAFSLINAFLLRPLPFRDADRLVHVWATDRIHHESRLRFSVPDFLDFQDRSRTVADLAAFTYTQTTLTTGTEPETLSACTVTGNTFQLLGVDAVGGRTFNADDGGTGRPAVAIVSSRLSRRRFGGETAVGRTIDLDGVPHTIVGVMPSSFAFPLNTTDVWMPQALDPERFARGRRFLQLVGRLKPGVTRQQAQATIRSAAKQLEQEHPAEDADHGAWVVPLRQGLNVAFETIVPIAVVLTLTNLIVMLIVCANVAGLALSSAVTRTREIAIRLALGSSRRRIMQQLLLQSVLLALAGGALGLLLAMWSVAAAARSIPPDLYRVGAIALDLRALGFALVVSLLTALGFGLAPAWRASRTAVSEHLKEETPALTTSTRSGRFRGLLVLSQVALGSMLVMAAALLFLTLTHLQRVDRGFVADGALTLKFHLPSARYPGAPQLSAFEQRLLERVRALPGVSAAGLVNTLPLDHETAEMEFSAQGEPGGPTKGPVANVAIVSPGYFDALAIPILSGRAFNASDVEGTTRLAIVNRALADRWWPGSNAVGQVLRVRDAREWRVLTVVGVAGNARQDALAGEVTPQIYLPQLQAPTRYLALVVRGAGSEVSALAPPIRGVIRDLDGMLPVTEVRTLRSVVDAFLVPQRSLALAVGRLALGALLLVIVGLYGIVAHAVAQRAHEIGVRVALGASPRAVLLLIARQTFVYLLPGLGLGLAGAIVLGRLLSHVVTGAATVNVAIAGTVMVLVSAVALLACWVPARRALAVDPAGALRAR
jgi:putative ABC transport system permease protein